MSETQRGTTAPVAFDRAAARLLLALGVLTLGTGSYFIFFRPAMLPEDVRLTGVDPSLLPSAMLDWLTLVFRTWGGFMLGFGTLMLSVSAYVLTTRATLLAWGVVLAVIVAFGGFLATNVILHSDYLWFIGVLFALALFTSLRILLTSTRPSPRR
jgi:hypothetical protein